MELLTGVSNWSAGLVGVKLMSKNATLTFILFFRELNIVTGVIFKGGLILYMKFDLFVQFYSVVLGKNQL